MRLSGATAALLPANVAHPAYDRAAQAVGIVHFGIGAFHRAHQSWYTDRAMDGGDRDWATLGVSLRSPDVAAQLNPQDGLYTVTERSAAGWQPRLVGAVRGVVVAAQDREALIAALAAPATRIASLTVTEKGYCRNNGGRLDLALAGDGSFYPWLAAAFRRRAAAGLPGLTLLSCDNLANNGQQLAALMAEFLDRDEPALRRWFESECACPSTMVDRIVPATTAADRADLAAMLGMTDEAAVMTEPFSQWVIEDRFVDGRPRWELAGAQIVADVAAYETAKLRMLNGAHSLLAYCGLNRGYDYVHEAVADPDLRALASDLLMKEAAPSVAATPGQDLARYADALLARFANPALNHRLIQIAMDGSQKLPQRWLATLAWHQQRGSSCPSILAGIAAWLQHVRGDLRAVDDPMAKALAAIWKENGGAELVRSMFGAQGLLASDWQPTSQDTARILEGLATAGAARG